MLNKIFVMLFLIIGISVFSLTVIEQEEYVTVLDGLLDYENTENMSVFDALYIASSLFAGEDVMAVYISEDGLHWKLVTAGHNISLSTCSGEIKEISINDLKSPDAAVSISDALTTAYIQNRKIPIAAYLKINDSDFSWNVVTPGYILEIDSVVPSVISNLSLKHEVGRMKGELAKNGNGERNNPEAGQNGGSHGNSPEENVNGNGNQNNSGSSGNSNNDSSDKNNDNENGKKR